MFSNAAKYQRNTKISLHTDVWDKQSCHMLKFHYSGLFQNQYIKTMKVVRNFATFLSFFFFSDLLNSFLTTVENGRKDELLSLLNCSLELLPFLLDYARQHDEYLVHKVCCHDYPDIVYLLIRHGGDLNDLNSEVNLLVALHWCLEYTCTLPRYS